MYISVSWQAFTDDAAKLAEISQAVDLAFGTLRRAKILQRTVVLRPATNDDVATLIALLDGVEQTYSTEFGYALFLHNDGQAYRGSDPFDVAAARAVTKADPMI